MLLTEAHTDPHVLTLHPPVSPNHSRDPVTQSAQTTCCSSGQADRSPKGELFFLSLDLHPHPFVFKGTFFYFCFVCLFSISLQPS